jgi:hypothetical protein
MEGKMTSQEPTATAIAGNSGNQPYVAALFSITGKLKDYGSSLFKQRKPWTEVVDRNSFSKPANVSEALTRIKKNSSYFKVNYLMFMLVTTAVTFLMHPTSLFTLGFLIGLWIYVILIRTSPLSIGGRVLSDREKLYGMAAISFITIFFLTSVGTVLFSALAVGMAVIVTHGAMRQPDDLFLDEVETNQGLLSVFSTGNMQPAANTSNMV